jgi:hypothetical protein
MITRLIFCAPYRIPVATVSLKFDYNIQGVSRNIIVSPVDTEELYKYLRRYGIDTNRFEHLPDQELIDRYPAIDHWVFKNDYRNNWLKQQALKLAALDYVDYDVALIHDPDTWMIQPYQPVDSQGRLCMLALENVTEGSYDPVLPAVLGMERQTQHCFVTEFMPVYKQDWQALKQQLEQQHARHFLDAIIDNVPETETIDGTQQIKWFSEYEFLGNWTASRRPVDFLFQKRFGIETIEDLNRLNTGEYNSICDHSSGMTPILGFDDWHTGNIPNYNRCIELLQQHFANLKSS